MTAQLTEPEFDRSIPAEDVGPEGIEIDLVASAAERSALAERFGLQECSELRAHARAVPLEMSGFFRLSVDFKANVIQSCVVTLDPVPARIEDRFELIFGPAAEAASETGEVEVPLEGEDPPEPLIDGTIPVGEAVAEHLALALDPYPRKPGVEWDAELVGEIGAGSSVASGPFAVLKGLAGESGQTEDDKP